MSKHNRPRARQLRTGIVLLLLLGAMCSCSGTPSRATTTAATVSDGARRDASTEGALTVDAHVALGEFVALVEQRLAGVAQSLKVLANVEQVQSGNWNAMQPPMRALAESGVAASAIWFARTDGSYLTLEQGAAAQTLSDRPYFDDLMTGKSIAGFLVVSRSTGKRSVVVAQPVVRAGQVVGAVGVSLSVDELSRTLDEAMKLPQGVVFYALDAQGQTALHRDPNLMFAYPSDLGDATLRAAVREMLSTDKGVVRYEFRGVSKAVLHQRSPKLGWVFALGFPAGTAAR